jgi:predicted  nucleic acid-binding Zn-ribbon protein
MSEAESSDKQDMKPAKRKRKPRATVKAPDKAAKITANPEVAASVPHERTGALPTPEATALASDEKVGLENSSDNSGADEGDHRLFEDAAPQQKPTNRILGETGFKLRFPGWAQVARLNVKDDLARSVFIGVLFGGSFVIGVGKLTGWLSAGLVAMVAVVCIIGFSIAAYSIREERVRLDRAGDNAYYLGLTYTLISMSVALIRTDFSSISANQLVGAFGVALSSTIVGIICRLALIQYREEVDDIETQVRLELTESASHLSQQLMLSRREFEVFVEGLRMQMSNSVQNIAGEHLDTQKILAEQVNVTLVAAVERIEASSAAIQDALKKQTSTVENFQEASLKSSEAASQLATKIAEIEIPKNVVEKTFEDIRSQIHEAASGLAESAKKLSSAVTNAGLASEAFQTLGKQSSDASEKLSSTVDRISALFENLDGFSEAIGKQRDGLERSSEKISVEIVELTKLNSEYVTALSDTAKFLAKEIRKDAES